MATLIQRHAGDSPIRFGQDGRWLAAMAAVTTVELLWWVALWISGAASVPLLAAYLAFAVLGLCCAMGVRLAMGLAPSRASWPVVAGGTVLTAVGASAFLPLKCAIPKIVPFWLDRPLGAFERALFGADPWLLLDRILGWAAVPMDWLYGTWLPVQSVALFMVMLAKPSRAKSRALVAYTVTWFVLGVLCALLLASAGPLFYDRLLGGNMFVGLGETLHARGAWVAIAESDRMWASMSANPPGLVAGVSAMPSMHVAISLWIVLAARALAPRLAAPAFIYFLLVWAGSVELGWHYASDGLAGVLGTIAIWQLTRLAERTISLRALRTPLSIYPDEAPVAAE